MSIFLKVKFSINDLKKNQDSVTVFVG